MRAALTRWVGGWASIAGLAQFGALASGAVTNLLYARLLAPSQVGQFAILLALGSALALLGDGGLQNLLTRALARSEIEIGRALSALAFVVPALVVVASAAAAGVALGLRVGFGWQVADGRLALLLELAVCISLFQASITLYQGLSRFIVRSLLILGNGVLTTVFTAVLLILSKSLSAAVHATAAAYLVIAVAALGPLFWRHGAGRFSLGELPVLFRQARPLWLNAALGYGSASADVLVAGLVLPIASVGYYQVIKKLALAILAPFTTLLPLLYASFSRLGAPKLAAEVRRVQTLSLVLSGALLLASAAVLAPVVGAGYGHQYAEHTVLLVVLVGAGLLQFQHNLLGYALAAAGRFSRPLLINVPVAMVMVGGAAAAGALAGLDGFVTAILVAQAVGVAIASGLTSGLIRVPGFQVALGPALLLSVVAAAAGLATFQVEVGLPVGIVLAVGLLVGSRLRGGKSVSVGAVTTEGGGT